MGTSRTEVEMIDLTWTEARPSKPGKYWWRAKQGDDPQIMSVLAYADGSPMTHCDYGQWSSAPIAEPREATT